MTVTKSRQKIRFVVLGGTVAAALDILFAFMFYGAKGISPLSILQSISSGLVGAKAYQGGMYTAISGLALHFLIAIAAAFVFYFAGRRFSFLVRSPLLSGAVYGVCLYVVMNYLVLPMSAFPHPVSFSWIVLLVHVVLVGIPIAWGVKSAHTSS